MVEKIKGKKEVQSHISLLTSYVLVYKRVQAYIKACIEKNTRRFLETNKNFDLYANYDKHQ